MTSRIKKIWIFITICFLGYIQLNAQGGSNYSIFGIGDINTCQTSAFEGLAGTSIAFPMEHAVNPINPAILSKSTQTRLMTGYKFNQNYIKDNNDNVLLQNNGKVSGLSTVFVIDTSLGMTVSFGFNPFSNVNYLIEVPENIEYEKLEVSGRTQYQGKGGVSIGYLGASANIFSNLSIGASVIATFGVINSSIKTTFDDYNFFYSVTEKENRFKGMGYRMGLLYEPINNLLLGAYTEQHTSLEYENEVTYQAELTNDTNFIDILNMSLPDNYGFGVSWKTGKFRIGADFKTYNLKMINFNEGPETEFRNMNIYSLGVSRLGNNQYNTNYFDKVTYNFGLGYKELYYKINNIGIDELYISLGMNFPVKSTAMIDAAFTFGTRGTTKDILVKEYFGRFSIDISIGETWFKPFRREY